MYQRDRLPAGLSLGYNLNSRLTLFVDGCNIFNEPSQYTFLIACTEGTQTLPEVCAKAFPDAFAG